MKVQVPGPLRSYTGGKVVVCASATTLEDLLLELDRSHPGFRFRIINEQEQIRDHIKIFINQRRASTLSANLQSEDTIHIICAISGG